MATEESQQPEKSACALAQFVKAPEVAPVADSPSIVIVGAGFGGLGCARALVELGVNSAAITVVEPKDYFSIGGLWQFVWTGRSTLADVKWPLSDAVGRLDVCWKQTHVLNLQLEDRAVSLGDGSTVNYDYLVLASGSVSDNERIPGLAENAIDLCDIGQAEQAQVLLQELIAQAKAPGAQPSLILVPIGALPYKCPPLPFEVAFLIHHELEAAGVRPLFRIVVTSPVAFPFNGPPPNAASTVFLPQCEARGIEFLGDHVLTSVGDGRKVGERVHT